MFSVPFMAEWADSVIACPESKPYTVLDNITTVQHQNTKLEKTLPVKISFRQRLRLF